MFEPVRTERLEFARILAPQESESRVTIIMPAYNAEETIAESIDSVLAQTHSDLELIIVDDGSTDATADIVCAYGDPRIVFLKGAHAGVSVTRNQGLTRARGAYIKYLDSDDLLNEVALERQIASLRDASDLVLGICSWGRFRDSLDELQVVEAPDWRDSSPLELLQWNLGGGGTMPPMTWLVPRALAERAGHWRSGAQLYEDTEYLTRLALGADAVRFEPQAWGYYRTKGAATLSGSNDPKVHAIGLDCVEEICRLVLAEEDTPAIRRMLANLCRRFSIRTTGVDARLADRAEALVTQLGGSDLRPSGGRVAKALVKMIGWRTTLRLKRALGR